MSQSKESEYKVDLRDTIHMPLKKVWNFLFSKVGLEIWLGTWRLDKWETGITFTTDNGVNGEVRVFNPYSHIRLSWQLKNWKNISILEVRTFSHEGKTIIHFHQEQLADESQKEEMERHWAKVLDDLISAFETI